MRKPQSALVLACLGVLAAVVVTTLVFEKYTLLPNLVFAAILASLGIWTVDTWRRLWRLGIGQWERLVFSYGVKRLGPVLWLIFVIMFPFQLAHESQRAGGWFAGPAVFFSIYALFSFPAWLWAGYLWGRTMAAFLGIEKPPHKSV